MPRETPFLLVTLIVLTSRVVLATDCNFNGIEDAEEIAAATSEDCNDDGVPDECESRRLGLDLRHQGFPTPRTAKSMVTGDVTGDGIADIIVGSQSIRLAAVSVFAGRDDGSIEPAGEFEVPDGLTSVSVGDLDGDGDVDIVTANSTVVTLAINSGDGRFETLVELPVERRTRLVTSADVTGDGLADLITAIPTAGTVSVLRNLGKLRFAPATTFAAGERPNDMVVADLDGDGSADLAVANIDSGEVTLHRNNGDGTFAPAVSLAVGERPARIRVADTEGDTDLDLVVGSASSGVSVLLNDGTGGFPDALILRRNALDVDVADMDGDADVDIVAGDASGVGLTVFFNDGSGAFGAAAFPTTRMAFVTVDDFDVDGQPDVALLGGSLDLVRVRWNGEDDTLRLQQTQVVNLGARPHGATSADVNGDGLVDVITADGPARAISILLNLGNGLLAEPAKFVTPGNTRQQEAVVAADIDSDGDADVIVGDPSNQVISVMVNRGDGKFEADQAYPAGGSPEGIVAADIDGDTRPEVLLVRPSTTSILVYHGDDDAKLLEGASIFVGTAATAIAPADLDGDGDLDLAVSRSNPGGVALLLNDGAGVFAAPAFSAVPGSARWVAAGDFDGDGAIDLATANLSNVAILLNDGRGGLGVSAVIPFGAEPPSFVSVGDVDGDAHLDLLTTNGNINSMSVVRGAGDGTFSVARHFPVGTFPIAVLPLDLDGDGELDPVVAAHDAQWVEVWTHDSRPGLDRDFLERICTPGDFEKISIRSGSAGSARRSTLYTLPARDETELLPTVFQNARRHPRHQEFLTRVFPEHFPALTGQEYNRVVGRRETRQYFAGTLSLLRDEGGFAYGFSVIVDGSDPSEVLSVEEVGAVRERLRVAFDLEPLAYFPDTSRAREAAAKWPSPGFPVILDEGSSRVAFEAYTEAIGYGQVRVLDRKGFDAASSGGELGPRTVLVLSEAPRDIDGVVAGVVTAGPQGELSQVAIRSARRAIPNAFLENATQLLASFDGQLVRLEVRDSDYLIEEASVEEAEAFWASNRPELSVPPRLDGDFDDLSSLSEIATMDRIEAQESRFGGAATHLARLDGVLDGSAFEGYREAGFAIPVRHYLDFMRSNRMPSALDPERDVTYEEYLMELESGPDFQRDSAARFAALEAFREFARENGAVDTALLERLTARVGEIFPSMETPLSFLPSSTVEVVFEINEPELHEFARACVADSLDENSEGPSLCDPQDASERDIEDALKQVWTSLHTFRASEERRFYGVSEEQAGMAVLVSRAALAPLANGVAFTGAPADPLERRYVVTAQVGEASVTHPEPGVLPERDLLEIIDGRVARIIRPLRGSTLLPEGEWVLSDVHLDELGSFMRFIDERFPIALGDRRRAEILLDLRFRLEAEDRLAVTQLRPFLLATPPPPSPTFEIEIVAGATACGVFQPATASRGTVEEHQLKSLLHFRGGTVPLPTERDSFAATLVDEVFFGPQLARAESLGDGLFRLLRFPLGSGVTRYRFSYRQEFSLPDGRELHVELATPLSFDGRDDEPVTAPLVVDEVFLTTLAGREAIQATLDGAPLVHYGSCSYADLPLYEIDAVFEDGTSLRLQERWLEPDNFFDTGPASLVRAEVAIAGESFVITDYSQLVYSAFRHNTDPTYWAILPVGVELEGVGTVRAVELFVPNSDRIPQVDPEMGMAPEPELSGAYLGESFQVLAAAEIATVRRELASESVLRGDVNLDGRVRLNDVVILLDYIFRDGESIPCGEVADADANGRVNVVDAIRILSFLAGDGSPLAEPAPACGP